MLSHPFTGLQMLLVVTAWAGVESVLLRNRAVPFLFAATMAYLLFLHLLYYVVLLNMFEEHRVIFAQWSLAWTEGALTALGADILVGLLAIWAMRTRAFFSQPGARLLAVWFVVSIILAHHDLIVPAEAAASFYPRLLVVCAFPARRGAAAAVVANDQLARDGVDLQPRSFGQRDLVGLPRHASRSCIGAG
jgi:hypothetical protein